MQIFVRGFDALEALEVNNNTSVAEIKSALSQRKNVNCEELNLYCQTALLADDLFVESFPSAELDVEVGLLGGKVHGSLARAGKVKGQTPKVEKQEKKKKKTGRAKRRIQYNRRFVNIVQGFGRRRGPNANSS
ncbi:FAU family protein [Megaselia abdita]